MGPGDDEGIVCVCMRVFALFKHTIRADVASTGVQSSVTVTKPRGIIHSLFVEENQFPL